MRFFFGLIVGCALTVGGAYVADTMSSPAAGAKMVNWDVVAKNLGDVSRPGARRLEEDYRLIRRAPPGAGRSGSR